LQLIPTSSKQKKPMFIKVRMAFNLIVKNGIN
jgi:hypothetical protein